LGLRVNYLTGAVGACCVACAATARASNLHPRLAGVCGCGALALALVPWAFGTSLAGLDGEGPGGGGGRVQATSLALAAWMAAAAAGAAGSAAAGAALLAQTHGVGVEEAGGARKQLLVTARGVWPAVVRACAGRAAVDAARLGVGRGE
jgi:hypothetical protein